MYNKNSFALKLRVKIRDHVSVVVEHPTGPAGRSTVIICSSFALRFLPIAVLTRARWSSWVFNFLFIRHQKFAGLAFSQIIRTEGKEKGSIFARRMRAMDS